MKIINAVRDLTDTNAGISDDHVRLALPLEYNLLVTQLHLVLKANNLAMNGIWHRGEVKPPQRSLAILQQWYSRNQDDLLI